MKVDHKYNFLAAFAYHREGSKCANFLKAAAYIPVIGALAQSIFVKETLSPWPESGDDWEMFGAFFARATISLVCPLLLPLIDGIGTVWLIVEEEKKKRSLHFIQNANAKNVADAQ